MLILLKRLLREVFIRIILGKMDEAQEDELLDDGKIEQKYGTCTVKEAELEELKNLKKELNRNIGDVPGLKKELNKLKYNIINAKISITQKDKDIFKFNKIINQSEKISNKITTSKMEKDIANKINKKVYINTIIVNSLRGGGEKFKDKYGFSYWEKGKQKTVIKEGVKDAFKYFGY